MRIGPVAGAAFLRRLLGELVDRQRIVAIDQVALDADRRAALEQVRLARRFLDSGGHGVLVVLDDEDEVQVPDGRQVQRFQEGTVVGRAVGGEGHRDGVGAANLRRQGGADTQRRARPDDAVGAEVAGGDVGDVHRAAIALAVAGLLLEQLRDHALHVGAEGDAVAVAAVRGGEIVALLQRRADAGGDAFLAEIGMEIAADQTLPVKLDALGLEDPDRVGRPEKFLQQLARRRI